MNTVLLVDGNALMHRSFHALPPFKTKNGTPTNVVYGFLSILHSSLSDFNPSHLLVCFDTPAPTFRNKLYAEYQAQRPTVANEFIEQIPLTKQALNEGGITHIELDGYEADDLLGTATKYFEKHQLHVLILTGDKDIMQLVNNSVQVVTPQIGFAKTKVYNPQLVQEKLGVLPHQIVDYKALVGDPSDNYKGANGIGPKTASKLLSQFGTLENLLQNLNSLPDGKIKESIKNNLHDVEISKQLAQIQTDVPISLSIEKTAWKGYASNLRSYLLTLEMHSLASRLFPKQKLAKKAIIKKEVKDSPQISLFT